MGSRISSASALLHWHELLLRKDPCVWTSQHVQALRYHLQEAWKQPRPSGGVILSSSATGLWDHGIVQSSLLSA